MGNLYQLLTLAQKRDKAALISLLQQFEPKVHQSLRRTTRQNRDDLKQVLHLKLLEAVSQFQTGNTPGFFDYIHHVHDRHTVGEPHKEKSVLA